MMGRCGMGKMWWGVALCVLMLLAAPCRAVTQLRFGADAPDFNLKDTTGADTSLSKLRGQIVVVIFGELYHDKTVQGCRQVELLLKDARFRDAAITPLLITAQEAKAEDFQLEAARTVSLRVLRDTQRKAFGAYQVEVMPSVVVIDKEGHVVTAVGGLIPQFSDTISDALLYATGKLSAEQFQRTRNPASQPAADETALKAQRTAALARQLALRGLDDLAAEKFAEAIKLDPHLASGRVDLGMLLLKRQRLAESEAQFKAALAEQPNAVDATLGLAFVQTQRGGPELDAAERTVRDVLGRQPLQPRAHYLLGLILQKRGKAEDAAASFKKAAELLLEHNQEEILP